MSFNTGGRRERQPDMELLEDPSDEIKQLRRCVNDLVSVIALPAIWSGGGTSQMVRTLTDVLIEMLDLDMVYVRLDHPSEDTPFEMVRFPQCPELKAESRKIRRQFDQCLGQDPRNWPLSTRGCIGNDEFSLAPFLLGLEGEVGFIVAGVQRPDFPKQTEILLLRVAANQVVIALHEARLLNEQRRVARELDERVAQRTHELAAANEELRKEVAERKGAEEKLRQSEAFLGKARSELAHATRVTSLGALTASIAHEVNQPLTAIANNANACLNLLPDSSANLHEIRAALGEIIEDAERASAVVGRVKQLVRKEPFAKVLLNLRQIVGEVAALARYESAAQHVTIRIEMVGDSALVMADRVQLQQVLLNLIVNGMDAMKTVKESKRILTLQVLDRLNNGVSEYLVCVQDTGVGLKPGETERMFEAFYTTKPNGMGMGLSVSRSIIEAHGGRLWAESNQGLGATFFFSLPAAGNGIA